MQYLILLVTRILTIIPMSIFFVKVLKRFRRSDRDTRLDRTALGMTLIDASMLIEAVLFAAWDIYRVFNHIPNPSPIGIILLWMVIRISLVTGIWIIFSILFENEED